MAGDYRLTPTLTCPLLDTANCQAEVKPRSQELLSTESADMLKEQKTPFFPKGNLGLFEKFFVLVECMGTWLMD